MGRILGSIGPWRAGEPRRFAPARRLYSNYWIKNSPPQPPYTPLFTYSNFLIAKENERLTLDIGNYFPINDALGTIDKKFAKFKVVVARSKITPPGTKKYYATH